MRNIKLVIEYDGTEFSGFQRIPGKRTIQGDIEKALSRTLYEKVVIAGAGRTDAGVHAIGQVVSFETGCAIPTEKIAVAVNSRLSDAIVVREAIEVPSEFHARYSAVARTYEYSILNTDMRAAIAGRFSWHVPGELDLADMRQAAKYLIGSHDFTAFTVAGPDSGSMIRNLMELSVRREGSYVKFHLCANAFLHNMARITVSTLVEVGQGKREASDVKRILESRDRRLAGKTAPAKGLVLMGVKY